MMLLGTHLSLLHLAFLLVSLLALLYLMFGISVDVSGGDDRTRMRRRLAHILDHDRPASETVSEEASAIVHKRRNRTSLTRSKLGRRVLAVHERLMIVGGKAGLVTFYAVPIVMIIIMLLGQRFLRPYPSLYFIPVALVVGGVAGAAVFRLFERRFVMKFLDDFPNALDLIVRAVRAGVPMSKAVQVASQELREPVRSEFKNMADSLRLGADMGDVLKEAASRIKVSDFNFFAVCILLQRETGGQMAETLDNLARIIRARRDIRLKAKALVAESRAASKAIGAIPFACLGFLYLINEEYLSILFTTETGHKLLALAIGMLAVGFFVINRMSQLED